MPTNEKYFYINRVGLTKGSWALRKFEEDAERHHMLDQPGKLAALRLTEYYELLERLNAAPGAIVSIPVEAQAQTISNGNGRSAAPRGSQGAATGRQPDDDSFADDVDSQWDMDN
jgi:hypothetical protein